MGNVEIESGNKMAKSEEGLDWKDYFIIGVAGYFALFRLPEIMQNWSDAAGSVKHVLDKRQSKKRHGSRKSR